MGRRLVNVDERVQDMRDYFTENGASHFSKLAGFVVFGWRAGMDFIISQGLSHGLFSLFHFQWDIGCCRRDSCVHN